MEFKAIFIALIAVYILYRVYRRIRRNFGWQRLQSRRLQVSTAILAVLGIVLITLGASQTNSLISDVAGLAIGVILALCGAAITRFEQREGSLYYLPNTWIGAIVTLLFFGRIVYRIYVATMQTDFAGMDKMRGITGGWTAGLMMIMISYYIAYNIFLLRKQKQQRMQGAN